ncbi:ABC-2 type transporter [Penicillium canescens]|uniref:ABC-2 type transporter n=1 Tax=Penicillium canescens TaxID=5083 RepID=A0AAD6N6H9_PENCN|nr:ABC-2 type transporter [Penicillium canescens]KAJ6001496.1 ABC-2 type transporter [Penicillium canescens]KAJ6035440.1 ABC-2 type transporter [Penicillium canescens]KAJ6037564.1 ABC-2 type transporter [Penicillium canescens]KAJ6054190.1 ABC-2 type transporter [Penicillium canescens]KAJ6098219.1 ABC-2 type transporter [Penicillium canescens]
MKPNYEGSLRFEGLKQRMEPWEQFFEIGKDDAALNPASEEFDLEKWLRHTIMGAKSEGIRLKSSGVIFKDLHVTGSDSALMLQETVGDLLMAPLRIGELFFIKPTLV